MAKSKNHTNQNQNYKAHRNGIKRMKKPKNMSQKGTDQGCYT
jgi:large subunit ribosomal protein L29e